MFCSSQKPSSQKPLSQKTISQKPVFKQKEIGIQYNAPVDMGVQVNILNEKQQMPPAEQHLISSYNKYPEGKDKQQNEFVLSYCFLLA